MAEKCQVQYLLWESFGRFVLLLIRYSFMLVQAGPYFRGLIGARMAGGGPGGADPPAPAYPCRRPNSCSAIC